MNMNSKPSIFWIYDFLKYQNLPCHLENNTWEFLWFVNTKIDFTKILFAIMPQVYFTPTPEEKAEWVRVCSLPKSVKVVCLHWRHFPELIFNTVYMFSVFSRVKMTLEKNEILHNFHIIWLGSQYPELGFSEGFW